MKIIEEEEEVEENIENGRTKVDDGMGRSRRRRQDNETTIKREKMY